MAWCSRSVLQGLPMKGERMHKTEVKLREVPCKNPFASGSRRRSAHSRSCQIHIQFNRLFAKVKRLQQIHSVLSAESLESVQGVCWFATRCKVCNALVYEAAAFLSKDACQGNRMAFLAVLRGFTEKYHESTCITRRSRQPNIVADTWPEMAVPQCSDCRDWATCTSLKRLADSGCHGNCICGIAMGTSLPERQTATAALVNNAGTFQC